MQKIGILSGTFDPVHNGHIAFADAAMQHCGLDRVYFLVEPSPRRKQAVKAFEHRTRMVELALKHHKGLGSIILQHQQFTVEKTLPLLQKRFRGAQLYYLMGDDFFSHLLEWPLIDSLIGAAHFVIGGRSDSQAMVAEKVTRIEQARGLKFRYSFIPVKQKTVSSSRIRAAFRRGQMPNGIDPEVARYIVEHALYASISEAES